MATNIPLGDIRVGDRYRKDLGDLAVELPPALGHHPVVHDARPPTRAPGSGTCSGPPFSIGLLSRASARTGGTK